MAHVQGTIYLPTPSGLWEPATMAWLDLQIRELLLNETFDEVAKNGDIKGVLQSVIAHIDVPDFFDMASIGIAAIERPEVEGEAPGLNVWRYRTVRWSVARWSWRTTRSRWPR